MDKKKKIPTAHQELLALSRKAGKRAYAPYSKLHVGAALVTVKGNSFSGCNVENASYGLTCCAERNAIFQAIREEGAGMKIRAIAITSNSKLPIPPCGACRQVIAEFIAKDKVGTTVIFQSAEGIISPRIEELLPGFFELKS
jgi:cytidine deaminase